MKLDYPEAIRHLISHLKRLPGIGPKSAERMALWLLQQEGSDLLDLATTLQTVQSEIVSCPECGFFATKDAGCALCSDPERDTRLLCVVEQPTDILPIEKTGAYQGLYHVLGGRLAPLDNVGPEDLRIAELESRVAESSFAEMVLALGADVSGEATANYLTDRFAGSGLRMTKLAQGMPVGGGLDNADTLTLHRAFEHRRGVQSETPAAS